MTAQDLALIHYWNRHPLLYLEHTPSSIYPERFARIPGIDTGMAQLLFAEMIEANFLNSNTHLPNGAPPDSYNNRQRQQFDTLCASDNAPILKQLHADLQEAIWQQVAAATAYHVFFSDMNEAILDFFDTYNTDPGTSDVEEELNQEDVELDLSLMQR